MFPGATVLGDADLVGALTEELVDVIALIVPGDVVVGVLASHVNVVFDAVDAADAMSAFDFDDDLATAFI